MAEELRNLAAIERNALVEGRNMTMILSPAHKKPGKPETTRAEDDRDRRSRRGE